MKVTTFSVGLLGSEGYILELDVDAGPAQYSSLSIDAPVPVRNELMASVASALDLLGLPRAKVSVQLRQDVSLRDSPGVDLAVLAGVLASRGHVPVDALERTAFWAEVCELGREPLRPAAGALVAADAAAKHGFRRLLVAAESADEASHVDGLDVIPCRTLTEVLAVLRGELAIEPAQPATRSTALEVEALPDLADLPRASGPLWLGKHALEVMAAGGHHLLLHGPDGSGRSMLGRRIGKLLPELDRESAIEVTKIHGIAHRRMSGLVVRPPIRYPHHTISAAGFVGGGKPPRPGEVSLAHNGVLVLDNATEFSLSALDCLREPMQEGRRTVIGNGLAHVYPARFQLLATTALCACGHLGDPDRACTCHESVAERYQKRLPDWLVDRIDLSVSTIEVSNAMLWGLPGETSAEVRSRIIAARQHQADRSPSLNAELTEVGELAPTARAYVESLALPDTKLLRLYRVARTIQDLAHPTWDPHAAVTLPNLKRAEAMQQPLPARR